MGLGGKLMNMLDRRLVSRWDAIAGSVTEADPVALRRVRGRARKLRKRIDRVLHVAEGRLARPPSPDATLGTPMQSDWAWRPDLWSGPVEPSGAAEVPSGFRIGAHVALYHDCPLDEICLRQRANATTVPAPSGIEIDVYRFEGSYLSLVIELPSAALIGLNRDHLVRFDALIATEAALEAFARLNVRHGPNTEQIVRELPYTTKDRVIDFDLAYSGMNERRVERAWIDLIFDRPSMNSVTISDVVLSRRGRAPL